MWILLNDCFFSIVKKDCAERELLVRSRRKGDIKKVFPYAKVTCTPWADYRYRAAIDKQVVQQAIDKRINAIDYDNFKDSVDDKKLHAAYDDVWLDLMPLQLEIAQ